MPVTKLYDKCYIKLDIQTKMTIDKSKIELTMNHKCP